MIPSLVVNCTRKLISVFIRIFWTVLLSSWTDNSKNLIPFRADRNKRLFTYVKSLPLQTNLKKRDTVIKKVCKRQDQVIWIIKAEQYADKEEVEFYEGQPRTRKRARITRWLHLVASRAEEHLYFYDWLKLCIAVLPHQRNYTLLLKTSQVACAPVVTGKPSLYECYIESTS